MSVNNLCLKDDNSDSKRVSSWSLFHDTEAATENARSPYDVVAFLALLIVCWSQISVHGVWHGVSCCIGYQKYHYIRNIYVSSILHKVRNIEVHLHGALLPSCHMLLLWCLFCAWIHDKQKNRKCDTHDNTGNHTYHTATATVSWSIALLNSGIEWLVF